MKGLSQTSQNGQTHPNNSSACVWSFSGVTVWRLSESWEEWKSFNYMF